MILGACQSGRTDTDTSPVEPSPGVPSAQLEPESAPAVVSPPTHVMSAADRVRLSFRADGPRFLANTTTHDAAFTNDALTLTPKHQRQTGAALTIRTREIARGNNPLLEPVRTRQVDAAGSLALDRNALVERFHNGEDSVEQTWTFAAQPEGYGDLVVRVDASGHAYAGETAHGLHFVTPNKLGFRYGHASWVDAKGVVTHIPARWVDGSIAIAVPEHVLLASAYPAVLDPTITAEQAIDAPVSGWNGIASTRSAVASSGAGFLAVWTDNRNGTTDIFGVRLDASGNAIDPTGISIAETAAAENNATVAFVGGEFVVAWDDGTSVSAARVSTAGVVTAIGVVGAGTDPALAARGAEALVAFTAGGNINVARFSGGAFGAGASVGAGVTATVAANSVGDYLVAYSQGAGTAANIVGRQVDAAGAPLGAEITITAATGAQTDPTAAFNGTDFVVLWTDLNQDPFGTRVTTAGAILDTHAEGAAIVGGKAIDLQAGRQVDPSVACTGAGSCFATWSDRRNLAVNGSDIFGVVLNATLDLVGAEVALTSGVADEQRVPAVAVDGANFRVTWEDRRDGGSDTIYSGGVNGDGSLANGSGANIVRANNRQVRPALAVAPGNNHLVVWSDSRSLANDIMGERLKPGGGKLGVTAISVGGGARLQNNPRVAFDGDYVVTFNSNTSGIDTIAFSRVTTAGAVTGGGAVSSGAATALTPSVANGGGVSLIVWQEGVADVNLFGALVPNGGAPGAPFAICTSSTADQQFPVVAFDTTSSSFVVAWQDNRAGNLQVFATTVSTAGAVSAECGAIVSPLASAPSIAFGSGRSLITWTDRRVTPTAIFGARVTTPGGALNVVDTGGIQIAAGGAQRDQSTVAFISPNAFVVAWTESGNIRGQNVNASTGTPQDPAYDISAQPEDESRPSLTTATDGTAVIIGYERQVTALDARRVMTRRIAFSGSGGKTCSTAAQCASGFCVDGFCCDTACGGSDLGDCQACAIHRAGQANGVCTVILNTTYRCRDYSGDGFCDIRELCNGVDATCPDDVGRREGQACDLPGGGTGTCPPNGVNGTPPGDPHVCQ